MCREGLRKGFKYQQLSVRSKCSLSASDNIMSRQISANYIIIYRYIWHAYLTSPQYVTDLYVSSNLKTSLQTPINATV